MYLETLGFGSMSFVFYMECRIKINSSKEWIGNRKIN